MLLSSSIYVSHLRRGAATRLGAHTICNDGVASMTARMLVRILENVRPVALVVRRDLVAPLTEALGDAGRGAEKTRFAGQRYPKSRARPLAEDADRLGDALGVPVRSLLRADAAYPSQGTVPHVGCSTSTAATAVEGRFRSGQVVGARRGFAAAMSGGSLSSSGAAGSTR